MEKFKLYFLNNKRLFIIVGCILAIGLASIGCYFYYQYMNRDTIIDISSNNFENDFIDDNENFEINSDNDSNGDSKVDEFDKEKESDIKDKDSQSDVVNDNNEVVDYIYVDIKGYVNKPGVYKVIKDSNKRIFDLITLAGGLKKDANTSVINLSTKLKDEMVVIIYSNKQIEDFTKTKEELKDKLEICDKEEVKNDGCITEDDIDNKFESDNIEDTSNGSNNTNNNGSDNEITSDKVNINTASLELLMTLSGIGESKARAIINYRNEVGLFENVEDIKNVSGIGDSAFEKIKDSITTK